MLAATAGARRAAVRRAPLVAASRPYASTQPGAANVVASSWVPRPVKVERQPFPRFQIDNGSEPDDVAHQCHTLEHILSKIEAPLTMERLEDLATAFLQANAARNHGPEMEAWRKRVLDEFAGDMKGLTDVANVFLGVSRDKSMAYALFKIGAEEGYADAALRYSALLTSRTIAVPNGPKLGGVILERLVQIKSPTSLVVAADLYIRQGRYPAAIKILHPVAEHHGPAMLRLGEAYSKSAPPDHTAAEHWYARAAQEGIREGYFMLGNMRARGDTSGGVPDYKSAFQMYEWAAASGHLESQCKVGTYYMEGKGVERNLSLTAEYWGMAAAQQVPPAQVGLARLLIDGKDVPRNLPRARSLLQKAISCEEVDANVRSEATELLGRLDTAQVDTRCTIL